MQVANLLFETRNGSAKGFDGALVGIRRATNIRAAAISNLPSTIAAVERCHKALGHRALVHEISQARFPLSRQREATSIHLAFDGHIESRDRRCSTAGDDLLQDEPDLLVSTYTWFRDYLYIPLGGSFRVASAVCGQTLAIGRIGSGSSDRGHARMPWHSGGIPE
ncbi:MAG: hypothetical protein PVSMB1_16400 [Gemmatimonadaceae bacterium]